MHSSVPAPQLPERSLRDALASRAVFRNGDSSSTTLTSIRSAADAGLEVANAMMRASRGGQDALAVSVECVRRSTGAAAGSHYRGRDHVRRASWAFAVATVAGQSLRCVTSRFAGTVAERFVSDQLQEVLSWFSECAPVPGGQLQLRPSWDTTVRPMKIRVIHRVNREDAPNPRAAGQTQS